MLTQAESKVVISTLTKRRSWLKKTLEDASLDPAIRKEHIETLSCLESAMKKLSSLAPSKSPVKKTAPAPSPSRSTLSIGSLRILIAEDQEESREVLKVILEDIGAKLIDEAKDGRETFDKIKTAEEPFHVVLCDWDMPELSGLEVHKKATASKTLGDAYFCMVTGVTEAKKIREAIQQGVSDYIVKPVDPDILKGKLKTIVEQRNQGL